MWEFPGGKIEINESPRDALKRELKEELGIEVLSLCPLTMHPHDYSHAKVDLDTFLVDRWSGEAFGREGQKTCWVTPEEALEYELLAGAYPLLEAAKLALFQLQSR